MRPAILTRSVRARRTRAITSSTLLRCTACSCTYPKDPILSSQLPLYVSPSKRTHTHMCVCLRPQQRLVLSILHQGRSSTALPLFFRHSFDQPSENWRVSSQRGPFACLQVSMDACLIARIQLHRRVHGILLSVPSTRDGPFLESPRLMCCCAL